MGLLDRVMPPREGRADKLAAPARDPVLSEWWGLNALTASGVNVTADTALRLGAVYACVRVLAETIATLPLVVYRRQPGGKARDPEHPLWPVLHDAPNADQTSFEWREMMTGHTALRGVSYSRIVEDGMGRTRGLVPLHPDRVRAFRAPDGRLAFDHTPEDGAREVLLDHEVLRLPGFATDTVRPLSPIALHRETVGVGLAAREYLARFYSNNAAPKGAIKVPVGLDDETTEMLRASFERRHRGLENQHRIAILDHGMEWEEMGISNKDAQYIENQQLAVTEIARIFRVPPHKIADLSKATFSNIESQAIEFVTDTVLPWVRRWEERLNTQLLTAATRRTHFIGFELKGLLRGDAKARAELYRSLFNIGAMSPNDIRRAEDMNEIEGGDTYYVPLNIAPSDMASDVLMRLGAGHLEKRLAGPRPRRANGNGEDHDAVQE